MTMYESLTFIRDASRCLCLSTPREEKQRTELLEKMREVYAPATETMSTPEPEPEPVKLSTEVADRIKQQAFFNASNIEISNTSTATYFPKKVAPSKGMKEAAERARRSDLTKVLVHNTHMIDTIIAAEFPRAGPTASGRVPSGGPYCLGQLNASAGPTASGS